MRPLALRLCVAALALAFSGAASAAGPVFVVVPNGSLSEGRTTVDSIATKYSPVGASNDPNHTNGEEPINVARFLREMGGNPFDIRYGSGTTVPSSFGTGLKTVWGNSLGAQAAE